MRDHAWPRLVGLGAGVIMAAQLASCVRAPAPGPMVSPATASVAIFAGLDALEFVVGSGPAGITDPTGTGRVSFEQGGWSLTFGDALVTHLVGNGDPCVVEPEAAPLISFAGPEAFILYAGDSPRFVALELESRRPHCWMLEDAPGLGAQTGARPEATTVLIQISRSSYEPTSPATVMASAQIELLGDVWGAEVIELRHADDVLRLTVRTEHDHPLVEWVEDAICEELDAELWAERGADGVRFELTLACDDCPSCEHSWSYESGRYHLWWPDDGELLLVSSEIREVDGENPGDHAEDRTEDLAQRSWRLSAGTLHHEQLEGETTTEDYWCTDTDTEPPEECCVDTGSSSWSSEIWTFEPDIGESFTRALRDEIDEAEPKQVCETA